LIISEREIDELIEKTARALDDALPMALECGLVG
jgi:hypothetical protein